MSITLITLVGYSAMGGAVGAGGLGQVGYQYGYIGYDFAVMNSVLILLIVLVFIIQLSGDFLSKNSIIDKNLKKMKTKILALALAIITLSACSKKESNLMF
jgi:ABC-type methionine transport system permease subunit